MNIRNRVDPSDPRNFTDAHIFKVKLTMEGHYQPPNSKEIVFSLTKRIPLQLLTNDPRGLSYVMDSAIRRAVYHNFWGIHDIAKSGGLDPNSISTNGINVGILFAGEDEEEAMASSKTFLDDELKTALAWYEKSGGKDCLSVHVEMAVTEEKKADLTRQAELKSIVQGK